MKERVMGMTQGQVNRYHVIKDSIEGKVTVAEAAMVLDLSERQITRLRKGVGDEGAAFLIHGNKGRVASHAMTAQEKEVIKNLYQSEEYEGANFQHFSELVAEREGIRRSYATIRRVLTEAGISSPKKRRRYKPHRQRARKAQEGLLIQLDATPYAWFGGRAKDTMHGGIDDATGKVVGLYMTKNECLHGYYETMRQIIGRNGIPISAYADLHTIFRSPKADKLTVEEQLEGKVVNDTQFGRAMKELGITLIPARSPQAKGRIERLWDTLQSRLTIEYRIHGITTTEQANDFLPGFIQRFNERFAVDAVDSEKAYRPCEVDLDTILCVKETRIADNGGVFSFHGKLWQIAHDSIPPKARVSVLVSTVRGILVQYKGYTYNVVRFVRPKSKPPTLTERKTYIPPDDHYYKRGKPKTSLAFSECTDKDVMMMLQDIFLSKYA